MEVLWVTLLFIVLFVIGIFIGIITKPSSKDFDPWHTYPY